MNAAKFRHSISSFDKKFGRVSDDEDRLLKAVERLQRRLHELATTKVAAGISARHAVAKLTDQLKSAIRDAIRQWTDRLSDGAPVQAPLGEI